jgi:hypothetical protein
MSKTDLRSRRPGPARSRSPKRTAAVARKQDPARQRASGSRELLARLSETPHLARAVARLPAEILHDVIRRCGLEDCGEVLTLVTAQQLSAVFDLDLWRVEGAGEERFDAARFCAWLEVLAEAGISDAARKVAEMDPELVTAGLSPLIAVFDPAVFSPPVDADDADGEITTGPDAPIQCDVGGYTVAGRRSEAWDTVLALLIALSAEHPDSFHRVMRGCRRLSNSAPEEDGLDELLPDANQILFDLKVAREARREQQGYVTPPQARAFLESCRELRIEKDAQAPASAIFTAYLRHIRWSDEPGAEEQTGRPLEPGAGGAPESTSAVTDLFAVLLEAGIVPVQPLALLGPSKEEKPRLARLQQHMQFVRDHDEAASELRTRELAFLANVLAAGCSLQDRALTTREAFDAAAATCNLGLENWPRQWLAGAGPDADALDMAAALPADFLVRQELVSVFQLGWAVLHAEVSMFVAEQLLATLAGISCSDREVEWGLRVLRRELRKHCRVRAPWRARPALDVITSLDPPSWAALAALVDELPVALDNVSGAGTSRALRVSASAFEYISENSQIAQVRRFMEALPHSLG